MKQQESIAVGDLVLVHAKIQGEGKLGLVTAVGEFVDVTFLDGESTCVHRAFIDRIKKIKESS